jgi:WD40 repeat protein
MGESKERDMSGHEEEPRVFAIKRGNGEINFTRRDFLKAASVATAATLAGCSGNKESAAPAEPAVEELTRVPTKTPEPTRPPAEFTDEQIVELCSAARAHNEDLAILGISPDGRFLVSFGDYQVKIWSIPDFALLKTIEVFDRPRAAFSPDSAFLVIGFPEGLIEVRSTLDWGVEKELFDHSAPIRDIKFVESGSQMASIDEKGVLILWDIPDFSVARMEDSGEEHTRIFINQDGKNMVTCGYGSEVINLWSLPGLKLELSIEAGSELIFNAAFSSDKDLLAAQGRDGWVYLWSLSSGNDVNRVEAFPDEIIWDVTLTPDEKQLITTSNGWTKVWSFPELEPLATFDGTGMDLLDDGKRYLTSNGTIVNEVKIWSLSSFEVEERFNVRPEDSYWAYLSPTDDTLIVAYYDIGVVEIYSIPGGELAMCLMDVASSPPEAEGIEIEVEVEGKVETYTLPCGSPIPAGAVCTCNCVGGSGSGLPTCSCVGHSSCSCVGHTSGGSHYWYPN